MNDIALLRYLGVKYICDLMVESKKVKYFVNVCSSEKVDSERRYQTAGFEIVVAPYPGCEFFTLFRNQKHCGESPPLPIHPPCDAYHTLFVAATGLRYDWKHNPSHVTIDIPRDTALSIQWEQYRDWDLGNFSSTACAVRNS